MKNLVLAIFLFFIQLLSFSQILVEPLTENKFCAGENITVSFNAISIPLFGNNFTIELSDELGSFSSPQLLDVFPSTLVGIHNRSVTLPNNSINGTQYKIRVIGNSPPTISDNTTQDFTIVEIPKVVIGSFTKNLIFSEYVEGSSNEKYLEIYNGTGNTIDLSDYRLRSYYNGSTSPLQDNQLSGTLNNGDVIVYKNASAINSPIGISHPNIAFNGDDAIELFQISTNQIVDLFGQIGTDPGDEWLFPPNNTQNSTLRRVPTVLEGVSLNPFTGFPTLGSEWEMFPIDTYDGLGAHSHDNGYSTTFCVNEPTVTLPGSPAGGMWSGNGITNASLGEFTPSSTNIGTNNISYTVTSNGCTNSKNTSLVVNPSPIDNLSDTSFSCSNTIVLNAGNNGSAYLWSTGPTSQTITRATAGQVFVTITNSFNCKYKDSTIVEFPSTSGGIGTWVWEGNTDSNWFEPCNWNKKTVPDNLSDVFIPGSLINYPKISANTAKCKSITIDTDNGAKIVIDIDNAGTLDVGN